VTFAAELATRGRRTVLLDADPFGGAVAQQLGIVDEMSGLLAAARLAATGTLAERFASVQRSLGEGLSVITGLPRPDRWAEVRPGAVEHVLENARQRAHVVVDTGFCLEQDPGSEFGARPARNTLTIAALQAADDVVVVGGADPVGLSRLARGLVELRELIGPAPVHVAVNHSRSSLGWSVRDIAGMVEGFARVASLHFLPEDRVAVDRALVAGRSVVEAGDSALGRAVAGLVDAVLPGVPPTPARGGRLRRRTAGTGRRR
jgi:MinD-like ATPase involved in chromosome partitioning or flagellar assembly